MTIETNQTRVDYAGNGSKGPFSIPFPFIQNTDLVVTLVTPTNQETILQLGYDYSLTGAGESTGGSLTLSKPLVNGYLLFIVRETPQTQPTRYREQGPYSARQTERAFDRQTLALQDVAFTLGRSLKIPKLNREILSTDIQGVGASKVLQFTPDGRGIRAVYPRDIFLNQELAAINTPVQVLNHGFIVGNWLALTPAGFILGDSSTPETAEVVGCVTKVIDGDNFILSSSGQITCLNGLNPGSTYFLGAKGQLSLTNNSNPNQISKPLLVAQSPTSGFILNYRGKINPDENIGGQHNVTNQVTQSSHGFLVAQPLCFNVATSRYELAFAGGSLNQALCVGFCGEVIDSDTFILITDGYISQASFPGLGQMYLSETIPGQLTATLPSLSGHFVAPVMDCDSLTSGYINISYPTLINNGAGAAETTNQDTSLKPGIITIAYSNVNGVLNFSLPSKAIKGDTFTVVGYNNALGWTVTQGVNQQVHFLETLTTRGEEGLVASTGTNDCFDAIVATVDANSYPTDFVIKSAVGNLNFT